MLLNYLKIAVRNLRRNRLYTGINIFGLAIGIAGCITIFLLVSYEYRFDNYRTDTDRVYRIYTQFTGAFEGINPGVPAPLGPYVRAQDQSGAIYANLVTESTKVAFPNVRKTFDVEQIVFVDEAYFQVFPDYDWLAGSPGSSLSEPQQVVLTLSQAQKYYGNLPVQDIVGRELIYFDTIQTVISGIVADPKQPTDLLFTDFISHPTMEVAGIRSGTLEDQWGSYSSSVQLWLKLGDDQNLTAVESLLEEARQHQLSLDEDADSPYNFQPVYQLQPFADMHFNKEVNTFDSGRQPADAQMLFTLLIVAGLLLVMAIVNFVNLETAQSTRRAREIGVRKVLGSNRGALVQQFLGEAFVVTCLAIILGLALSGLAFYLFREFIPEAVSLDFTDWRLWAFIFGLAIVVPLLSGLYPAWLLSSFRPISALQDQIGGRQRTAVVRRILIVGQFALAQLFLFGTLTYSKQLNYLLNKDLGITTDGVVNVNLPWPTDSLKLATLEREVDRLPGIASTSKTAGLPMRRGYNRSILEYYDGNDTLVVETNMQGGDTSFVSVYGMELLAGRNYRYLKSAPEVIVNESFMAEVGVTDPNNLINQKTERGTIVGVVANYHVQSLYNPYEPAMLFVPSNPNRLAIKLDPLSESANHLSSLAAIEKLTAELYPTDEVNYTYFDEHVAQMYRSNIRTSKLATTATILAIIIACIGLLGLISYSVVQRTKEIGIRKVLGASITSLVSLLAKDFVQLVLIAAFIALPLGYYLIDQVLQEFAFRVSVSWWIFAGTTLAALLLCLLTIALRSYGTARLNPSETLRRE